MSAVVLGNGESRRGIDLESYKAHTLIGCNAIHRDFDMNHLICCDRRMADEATNNIETQHTQIYVRENWYHYFRKIKKKKNIQLLPQVPTHGEYKRDQANHWGSGGYAVLLAATLAHKEIQLIGFDLHSIDTTVNNMYKGTPNYAKIGSQAVDPSYWIYQIGSVFAHWPLTQFIIRNHRDWPMPVKWQKNNVKFIAL